MACLLWFLTYAHCVYSYIIYYCCNIHRQGTAFLYKEKKIKNTGRQCGLKMGKFTKKRNFG